VPREIEQKRRLACPACGRIVFSDPKVAVVALVTRARRLLLVQRRYAPAEGRWVLPGGFLDAGEDPRDVARREVHEETGLLIEVGGLIEVIRNPVEEGGASLVILYRGHADHGEPRAADDAADAGFFALDDLPALAFRSTERAIALLDGEI
jgi:8-oxo-dGTP diphosphatase